jgi:hypothetical protein
MSVPAGAKLSVARFDTDHGAYTIVGVGSEWSAGLGTHERLGGWHNSYDGAVRAVADDIARRDALVASTRCAGWDADGREVPL